MAAAAMDVKVEAVPKGVEPKTAPRVVETDIDFLERLLREPQLREQFRRDPQRTCCDNGVTLSAEGEAALMQGLSNAVAFAFAPTKPSPDPSKEHEEATPYFPRHPFSAPGDPQLQPGPQAVLLVVQAVTSVVQAVATVVAAAATVYMALSSGNDKKQS